MVQDDEQMYEELNDFGAVPGPTAQTVLCSIEYVQDSELELIEFGAEEANWFEIVVRTKKVKDDDDTDITYADEDVKKQLRLNGDGQFIYEGSFKKPIMKLGALSASSLKTGYTVTNEILIRNINPASAAGKIYAASLKLWERKGLL